jgi:GrpB-like predicted nucleotidyltransferase (UPF0157 family)
MSSVIVIPYASDWPSQFARVQAELLLGFADIFVQVEHIGSTSIPGLASKPVIDVLLGARSLAAIESKIGNLALLGYQYVPKYEQAIPMRRYFVKPEENSALRVHLHAVVVGSPIWQEHIAFREALRSDDALRVQYQALKVELAAQFPHDKTSYTQAKAPFVRSVLASIRIFHSENPDWKS